MEITRAKVNVSSLNVRNGPSTAFLVVGKLPYGREVSIISKVVDMQGNVWARLTSGYFVAATYNGINHLEYFVDEPFPHLYKIKDDLQAGIVPKGTRPYLRTNYPSTVRIRGGKGTLSLPDRWLNYIYSINSERAIRYIFKDASGWHNKGPMNTVEQLTFSGNVVNVLGMGKEKFKGVEYSAAYIDTYNLGETPPTDLFRPMPHNLHPKVHLFSTQYADGLDMSTDSRFPRILLLANPGEKLWIDARELVRLP